MTGNLMWIVTDCPLRGGLLRSAARILRYSQEPWRANLTKCITEERLASSRTTAILGLTSDGETVVSTFVSRPDKACVVSQCFAYIHSVWTDPDWRGLGMAKRAVEQACVISAANSEPILLACGDPIIREHLYRPLGFDDLAPDPWLMVRNAFLTDCSVGTTPHEELSFCRAASCHDIATVQSICAGVHWLVRPSMIEQRECQEQEEAFCRSTSEVNTKTYLIRTSGAVSGVIAWCTVRTEGDWEMRVAGPLGYMPEASRLLLALDQAG
jgi:hypothetical protein